MNSARNCQGPASAASFSRQKTARGSGAYDARAHDDHGDDDVERSKDEAGDEGGCEKLRNRLLGDGCIDDENDRGRDQDPDAAAGRQRTGG